MLPMLNCIFIIIITISTFVESELDISVKLFINYFLMLTVALLYLDIQILATKPAIGLVAMISIVYTLVRHKHNSYWIWFMAIIILKSMPK